MSQDSDNFGSIRVDGNEAIIRFKYNTECFKVISKIPGASYQKELKSWRVPIVRIGDVLRSPLFGRGKFFYDFDEQALARYLQDLEQRVTQARERVRRNPFCVTPDDIALLDFDVVISKTSDNRWLSHRIGKKRSVKKLLQELPYVLYSKKERAFISSSFFIQRLCKIYRDNNVTFAVEESVSNQLKQNASVRSAVQQGFPVATSDDVTTSFLGVAVDFNTTKGGFSIEGLQADVKGLFGIGKSSAKTSFSPSQVAYLFYLSRLKKFPFTLTTAAHHALEGTINELTSTLKKSPCNFKDEALAFYPVPICFRTDERGNGGFSVNDKFWNETFKDLLQDTMHRSGSVVLDDPFFGTFVRTPTLFSVAFFEEVISICREKNIPFYISQGFQHYLKSVKERSEALQVMVAFQQQQDCQLSLSEQRNADRLYPHQRVAVSWMLQFEAGMLGDDMGLGKTLSVLTAFDELKRRGTHDLLLVICPNSLVRNWIREASSWFPSLSTARLPDQKRERAQFLQALQEQRIVSLDVLIINFESMRLADVWPGLQTLTKHRSVFLCIDESQRIKNPQSKTFAALREFAFDAKKRFLLSGTPTPKDISDIWAQFLIIDKGERFGKSFYNWLRSVAELGTKWSEFAVKKFIPHAVEETIARVHELLLRRKKEDVINLPEKIFLFRDVELVGDQKRRYDELRKELTVQLRNLSGKETVRVIENVFEEYLRAVQMASNPRLLDPTWKGEPAKFVELDEIVSDLVLERGEKLVIWTNYLGNVRELTERYKAFGATAFSGEVSPDERARIINEFQDSKSKKFQILVAVPAAGGVGITLTAAQTAVYLDRTWNAEHWLQSIDRVHRIGQKGTVRIIVLNASKVDELIGFNLKRKSDQMNRLLSGGGDIENLLPSIEELLQALQG